MRITSSGTLMCAGPLELKAVMIAEASLCSSWSMWLTAVVTLPLVLAGPAVVRAVIPDRVSWLNGLYWPIVLIGGICFLATLYHVSVPVRTRWRFNLPGAGFTMFCWVFGSILLRTILVSTAKGSTSIYGPLATPIAVLLWLYVLSIAVLIGAALNAALDAIWPQSEESERRMARALRQRLDRILPRPRRDDPRGEYSDAS